jgi:Skp family chaperone for outer membrane proteins
MRFSAVALSCLLGTSALHAEWKVATVRMSDLFHHHPDVIAYREEVQEKKLKITQDVRAKALEQKRNEVKQMNLEWSKVMRDFDMRKVKDDKGPEAEKVREYRTRRNLAEDQVVALTQEFQEYQREQLAIINKEMVEHHRMILERLTLAVQKYATDRGFDVLYEVSGNSHVGLPTLVYVRPELATDLTEEMKKKIDAGECR